MARSSDPRALSPALEAAADGSSSSPSAATLAAAASSDPADRDRKSVERLRILAEASEEQYFADGTCGTSFKQQVWTQHHSHDSLSAHSLSE